MKNSLAKKKNIAQNETHLLAINHVLPIQYCLGNYYMNISGNKTVKHSSCLSSTESVGLLFLKSGQPNCKPLLLYA